jgi:DNA topoisomerase-1
MALQELQKFDSQASAKRNIRDAIQKVAARLGNTPTICRKCYIHPEIITTYIEGSLLLETKEPSRKGVEGRPGSFAPRGGGSPHPAAESPQPDAQGQAQGQS